MAAPASFLRLSPSDTPLVFLPNSFYRFPQIIRCHKSISYLHNIIQPLVIQVKLIIPTFAVRCPVTNILLSAKVKNGITTMTSNGKKHRIIR